MICITQGLIWLALHRALSADPRALRRVGVACGGDVGRLADSTASELDELLGAEADGVKSAISQLEDVRDDWGELRDSGVELIPYTDARYPRKLKHLSDPPSVIYALGNLSILDQVAIGICGSRAASEDGLQSAEVSGAFAGKLGVVVVSGSARGVDTSAHLGALKASGDTIMVLAEGISRFRLKGVIRAVNDAVDRILVISQFYPRHIWLVSRAMTRNAIICGLSEALVVVEARENGGTIAAGRECIKQGKPLYVLERSVPEKRVPGNEILIREGGVPLTDETSLRNALLSLSFKLHKGSTFTLEQAQQAVEAGDLGERQLQMIREDACT